MTIDADVADDLTTQPVRRDNYGRYKVVPPKGGKAVGYTRCTTVSKAIEDSSSLVNWRGRMVGLGLAQRPDLVGALAVADPTDRKTVDGICERAAEAGGSTVRRDLGTTVHHVLERHWTEPDYEPPAAYAGNVTAVNDALTAAGLTVVPGMHERIVVNDQHKIAGTFDLLVTDGQRTYVADLKTGAGLYGALAWAIQLFIYQSADALYTQGPAQDGSEDTREPMPELDQDRAVIIHTQPGEATAELYWLDLTVGAEGLYLAMCVREIRKAKPLLPLDPTVTGAPIAKPVNRPWRPQPTPLVAEDRHQHTLDRIAATIAHGDAAKQMLAREWPYEIPKRGALDGREWDAWECERIGRAVTDVATACGVPFPDQLPPGTDIAAPTGPKHRPAA